MLSTEPASAYSVLITQYSVLGFGLPDEFCSSNLFTQSSPLTVQPASGNVGVGTSDPHYPLDVNGTVHATGGFVGDGAQLSNLPVSGSGADMQIFATPGTHTWTKPANAKLVYASLIGGGQGGGSGRRGGNSQVRGGGAGGHSGFTNGNWIIASSLSATETVTVGGGGAGASAGGPAGSGANGATYGAEGGGGGASRNGSSGSQGGAGAPGIVIVITTF